MSDGYTRLPIIAFAQNEWQGPWMNRQELLSRLAARGWTIAYSTGAWSVWDRGSDRWRAAPLRGRFRAIDGVLVDEPGRLTMRWPGRRVWDAPMLAHHSRRLSRAVSRRRNGPLIVQVFAPEFLDYAKTLEPTHLAFHVRDYYPGFPGWSVKKQHQLDELAERADLITCAGPDMISCLPRSVQHRARPLFNAGNPQPYLDAMGQSCPADLAAIPKPRIGYVGNINGKCDFEMVHQLAELRPDWHWVFVGGVVLSASSHQALWAACLARPNVHWLGMKHRHDVPRYVAHMDVNALLFRTRGADVGWVRYTNPLRVNGCLASGRPVVGVDIPALRRLAPLVHVATTRDEWDQALAGAIEAQDGQARVRRQARAREASWDKRALQLETWLCEMVAGVAPNLERSATARWQETGQSAPSG